jgi:DNA-binding NarL/FixJ family response regulator
MEAYRILLADDHAMFRAGVRKMLEKMPGVEVVAEAADGLELIAALEKAAPNLILLDITMPNMGGIEAAGRIRGISPEAKILILTMHRSREYFHYSISTGASGYLLKQDADEELYTAIERIRQGETYVSPLLASELSEDATGISPGARIPLPTPLSPREMEVLKLIAEGKTSREIAEGLFLSIRTVEHHRANILKKTRTRSTADLIRFAFQQGYLS